MGVLHQKVGTIGIGVYPELACEVDSFDLLSLPNSSTTLLLQK